jgi:hypothetical protein
LKFLFFPFRGSRGRKSGFEISLLPPSGDEGVENPKS